MLRRFAYPFFDAPAATGAPSAVADAPPAPVESESLSDHEAQFSPDALASAPPAADPADDEPSASTERDATGRFKPRHRAASQRADADDVPAIAEQTRRIKEAEAKLGADIARLPGESDRVYTLRRRAELLERQASAPSPAEPPKPPAAVAPPPVQRRQSAPIPQTFPSYEQFVALDGNAEKTYEDYVDARADWRYAVQRAQERAAADVETQQLTHAQQVTRYTDGLPAAKTKYPDWDTVVTAQARLTPTMTAAILACADPHAVAYYLGTHPEIRVSLNAAHQGYNADAVADLVSDLDSLVASQRSSPPRTAAASTVSAPAAPAPPLPKPPNTVRTGSIANAETPPGDDDMSISAHEKHFMPKRRA